MLAGIHPASIKRFIPACAGNSEHRNTTAALRVGSSLTGKELGPKPPTLGKCTKRFILAITI